jgi:flagellar protein FlaF
MSHEAYRRTSATIAGPRDAEYRAFSEATRLLIEASAKGHDDLKALAHAVHMNRQLWGALASDCANANNALPLQTRAAIISLARWVRDYSSKVVRGGEGVEPLIEVNRTIMDGLAARPAA